MYKQENMVLAKKITAEDHVLCAKYINDGVEILTSQSNGTVRIYKHGSMQNSISLHHQSFMPLQDGKRHKLNIPATSCAIMPNSTIQYCLVCYTDGNLNLFDVRQEKIVQTVFEDRQIFNVVHHISEKNFVTLGDDGEILMYDSETMRCIRKYRASITNKLDGHSSRIFSAVFHPANVNEFISGGWDNVIMFWDKRIAHAVKFIGGPHICGEGIDFRADGKEFLTASYQDHDQIQIWDYYATKLLTTLKVDKMQSKLYCGKWINKESIAVGGSDPALLRVINIANGSVGFHRADTGSIYCLDFKFILSDSKSMFKYNKEQFQTVRILFSNGKIILECDCKIE